MASDVFDGLTSQPDGDVFDRISPSRRHLGAADIPRGGGEVREYTGKQLTGVHRIAGPIGEAPKIGARLEDDIVPGIQGWKIEDRAVELWEAAGKITPKRFPSDIDEHWINAKLELMEEKIAEEYNVSPEEVEGYVNDYMFVTGDDPENLLVRMVSGTLQYGRRPEFNPLTAEVMRTYTDQGYSKQEIKRLYNEKKEVFDAQWDRLSKQPFSSERTFQLSR